ncbi:hypothetical protein [Bathycoccus sp. RCC716 virus 1]|uniref:Uncharacterized protein n=1 Tax=Bathycoccus sp. RCC716 virus 1 TaxID=2530038 RepID=A0A7S6NYW3_9PHYC|nr:hypothetical protein [Bathycoccus sp. RCC716 virus 1]
MIQMDPFKKRVTKNDKKAKKGLYTQKYIRLKQETLNTNKKEDGSVQPTKRTLQSNGRVNV